MAARLTSRLPQIAAELKPRLEAALAAGAERVAQEARDRVPVASGDLRRSIHTERTGPGEVTVVAGDADTFHGHFVEFGTSHSPAQPFLIPALEARRDEVLSLAQAALKGL